MGSDDLICLGGSNAEDVCEVPVGMAVWGDVRIDFYRHTDERCNVLLYLFDHCH